MKKIPNEDLGRLSPEEFAALEKMPVTIVLDNIRSLNNVGSFFRTADAFMAEKIVICGITGTPPSKEIHKTALGAENTVAWEYCKSTTEAVHRLASEGYITFAVEQVQGAVMLNDMKAEAGEKYALVFGNEVAGVSQEVVDICRGAIEIPQAGTKHSLNVAVSGGIVLWQFFCFYNKLS